MPGLLKRYGNFDECAARSEYWGVLLISWLVGILALGLALIFMSLGTGGVILGILVLLGFGILTFWVSIATAIRRCRDAGINTWFVATLFIPYLNWIPFIVFGVLPTAKKD